MGKRLYVGNLPYDADEARIRAAFGQEGRQVQTVHIVMDRETGRPRGFAFVEMASEEDARKAIATMDGTEFGGRRLRVNEAEDRRPGGPGGGAGGPPRGPRPAGAPAPGPRSGPAPDGGGNGGRSRPWSGGGGGGGGGGVGVGGGGGGGEDRTPRKQAEKPKPRRKHDEEEDYGGRRGSRRFDDDEY